MIPQNLSETVFPWTIRFVDNLKEAAQQDLYWIGIVWQKLGNVGWVTAENLRLEEEKSAKYRGWIIE